MDSVDIKRDGFQKSLHKSSIGSMGDHHPHRKKETMLVLFIMTVGFDEGPDRLQPRSSTKQEELS